MDNEDVILKVGIDTDDAQKKLNSFASDAVENTGKIKMAFAGMGSSIVDNMETSLSKMVGFSKIAGKMADELAYEIKKPFSETNEFIEVGQNAGYGIVQGLAAVKKSAAKTAAEVASGIIGSMKSVLQIHSPSRVMKDMFETDFANGIVLGLENSVPKITAATRRMCDAALSTAISQSENFRDIGSNYIALMESGIEDQKDNLLETAQDVVDEIVKAAKDKDKEAGEEYSKIGKNIMSSLKESLEEGADRAGEALGQKLDGIISQFKTSEKLLLESKQSMQEKLADYGSLYNNIDGEMELSNLKDNIKTLEEYNNVLTKLKEKGTPNELLSEITGMGVDEGLLFSKELLSNGDIRFKEYIETWKEQQRLANTIAEDFYKEQLKILQDNYLEDIKKSMADYPETMNIMGVNTMQGFINGMLDQKDSATDAVNVIINAIKSRFREGFEINSPSKWAKRVIGKNIALGIVDGYQGEIPNVIKTLETGASSDIVQGIKDALSISMGGFDLLGKSNDLIKDSSDAKEINTNTIIKEKVVGIDCQGGFKEVARAIRPYMVEEYKRVGTSLSKSEVMSNGI